MVILRSARTRVPLLALAAAFSLAGCGRAEGGGGVVRFGLAGPLEQFYGDHVRRGAELARDRVNYGGGIRGRTLELVAVSDSADARRAVAIAESFYNDESVVAVIGHANSGTTLAVAPIYNRGLAAVSPSATSPEVSEAGPSIFRVASSDAANSAWLAQFAMRELGNRAAILYANDSYGRGLRNGFARAFRAAGGAVLEEYPYIEGRTENFDPYLLGIQASRPELVFVAGLDAGAAAIIRGARSLGIDVPFLGGDGLLGLVGQDPVYEGTYVGLLYHPNAPGAEGEGFADYYFERYGEQPDHFAALGYDAVMLVAEAASAVGFGRAAIRDHLAEVGKGGNAFEGVTGQIVFDANGDPMEKRYAVGRISGQTIELVRIEGGS